MNARVDNPPPIAVAVDQPRRWRAALAYGAVGLASLALCELALESLLRFPVLLAAMPDGARRGIETLYDRRDRRVDTLSPACGRHDGELFYTFRPGACRFANREFDVRLEINSQGLRDDEESLRRPEVIVLGDSHAAGWGVAQDEAFPAVIERRSGLKVLNAAVSSYGTAREVRMLERLDRGALKALVIQYCSNDYAENRTFAAEGRLGNRGEAEYQRISAKHVRAAAYFPFKHSVYVVREAVRDLRARPAPPSIDDELAVFLPLLARATRLAGDAKVIVTEMNARRGLRAGFLDALRGRVAADPDLAGRVTVVDSQGGVPADAFFVLDEHMNARGHEAVGARLAAALLPVR